jgi:DNA/RNA-binding domain of Phe-tRNA-synthetase-like protein
MKFIVDEKVFEKLKNYCVGVVVARNADNSRQIREITDMLNEEVKKANKSLCDVSIKDLLCISPYRNAMQAVGINPNRFPCSIEAMLKRVQKSGVLPSVNAAVDLNNYIAVKFMLPMGSHDIDALEGDIHVRFSKADAVFMPLGEAQEERLDAGELVYSDDLRIRTRKWIHKQSEIGKINPESKNIFFPIDGFSDLNKDKILAAAEELEQLLHKYFKCETMKGFVNKDLREITIK